MLDGLVLKIDEGEYEMHPLKQLLEDRKSGPARGIYSACSASRHVLEAVVQRALETGTEG